MTDLRNTDETDTVDMLDNIMTRNEAKVVVAYGYEIQHLHVCR